jgi:hypothetical protein
VLVELDLLVPFEPIEVLEEQKLFLRLASSAGSPKVLDECPRIEFLLDVERDGGNGQGANVLFILSSPHELGIGVGVPWVEQRAFVRDGDRVSLVVGNEIPKLLGRDVRPLVCMSC